MQTYYHPPKKVNGVWIEQTPTTEITAGSDSELDNDIDTSSEVNVEKMDASSKSEVVKSLIYNLILGNQEI